MTTDRVLNLLIAEDHALARLGTVTMLGTQADFHVVGQAENGPRAVELYRALKPDVLICDMRMPDLDGVQVTTAVRQLDPNARVLILSHYDGEQDVFRALKAGAKGYLTKDTEGDTLVAAIRAVAAGQRYLPASLAGKLAEHVGQPTLSFREQQVLGFLCDGISNREIATHIGITERTVALHVSNLLAKLGAKTRTEAVAIGMSRGLVPAQSR